MKKFLIISLIALAAFGCSDGSDRFNKPTMQGNTTTSTKKPEEQKMVWDPITQTMVPKK